jgi:hypothetical protein
MSRLTVDPNALPRRPSAARFRWLIVLVATIGCQRDLGAATKVDKRPNPASPPVPSRIVGPPTSDPEPLRPIHARGRVVAVGDLHGDLAAARRAFRLASVVDESDRWIGGDSIVVQTGDILDRGDKERALVEWLDRLAEQAKAAGGALHRVQGNHEIMNVAGDLRYVTEAGFSAFADHAQDPVPARGPDIPSQQRGRRNAFRPGGPWAERLAAHPLVLQVDDSVFVHGGLLPEHLRYGLARLNAELSAWMRGAGPLGPLLSGDDAPYWDRTYGDTVTPETCRALDDVLSRLSAKRLVIGHTPQKGGISFACAGHVARIDVGLSAAYGNHPAQVLEIAAGTMKVLTEAKSTR